MAVFFIIFSQEIRLNFRHLERILANFLFFIIFLSAFSLISQNAANTSFIWFALLSVLIFSNSEFLKKDFEDGSLDQISLSCENLEVAIFAKMLASWIVSCAMILPVIFVIKPDFEFLLIIFLASLAINFLCCFCGSLSILANSAPLIAVIILPLILPILLVAQGDFDSSYKLLGGLMVFLGIVSVFATAKIVKIAAE
jgi:heme exporter protein B